MSEKNQLASFHIDGGTEEFLVVADKCLRLIGCWSSAIKDDSSGVHFLCGQVRFNVDAGEMIQESYGMR